jgi:hypothetical protein
VVTNRKFAPLRKFLFLPMSDQIDYGSSGLRDPIGLCADCRYARVVQSSRHSTFYLCRRSASDPCYAKYPRLPVLRCAGYEATDATGDQR